MSTVIHQTGLKRLPLRAAAFVALVCVVIVGMSGWREWSSREARLKVVEVQMSNLARSLTQHAEDTVELAETLLVGIVSGLETDGAKPDKIARIQTILNRRRNAEVLIDRPTSKHQLQHTQGVVVADRRECS